MLVAALVGVCFGAAACVSYSGTTLAAQVRSWAKESSFVSVNNTLVDDVARARLAVQKGSALELRTVCAGFEGDIGTAYTTLPAPSTTLTNTLNAADTDFFKAASACADAGSVHDASVNTALSRMASGLAILRRAGHELAADGLHWVPRR